MILLTATERNSNLTTLSEKIANGFGRSLSQGTGDCTKKGESLFLCPKSIMVGVLGSIRACWLLDPVYQPNTSTAQSLVTFGGSLKDVSAVKLGEIAVREAIIRAKIEAEMVDEVLLGCVLQSGLGQNIARQVTLNAGLPEKTPAMTINKVCGSGLRAVSLAAQIIKNPL